MKKDPDKNPDTAVVTPAESKKKKKAEAEGSRFAALFILILTIVLSIIFWLQGGATGQSASKKDPSEPSFIITK